MDENIENFFHVDKKNVKIAPRLPKRETKVPKLPKTPKNHIFENALMIFAFVVVIILLICVIYFWVNKLNKKSCKNNCSGNGKCNDNGYCECNSEFDGEDCSKTKTT